MPQEAGRTTKRKRVHTDGDNPDQAATDYVDVAVITKISFIGRNGQEWEYTVENTSSSKREVHVVELKPSDDGGDNTQKLSVERVDMWPTIGMGLSQFDAAAFTKTEPTGQETQNTFDNKTGEDTKPIPHFTAHSKTHVYRYKNPDDEELWVDSELIDEFSMIGPNGQEEVFTLKNPAKDDDSGQADPSDPDITDNDPPWRIDPFQNIVDFNLRSTEFMYAGCVPNAGGSGEGATGGDGRGWPAYNGFLIIGQPQSDPASCFSPPGPILDTQVLFMCTCFDGGGLVGGVPLNCTLVTIPGATGLTGWFKSASISVQKGGGGNSNSAGTTNDRGASGTKTSNGDTIKVTNNVTFSGGTEVDLPEATFCNGGVPGLFSGFHANTGAQVLSKAGKPVPAGAGLYYCEGSSATYSLGMATCSDPQRYISPFGQAIAGACNIPTDSIMGIGIGTKGCVSPGPYVPDAYHWNRLAKATGDGAEAASASISWSGNITVDTTHADGTTTTKTYNPVGWQGTGGTPQLGFGGVSVICRVQPKS
jgi:hypothetical protein